MNVGIRPLGDRLLVRRLEREQKGLIVLTDAPESRFFEVLAVGPGKVSDKTGKRQPIGVSVGDVVVLPGVAADFPDFKEGEEFLVQEGDIGVIANNA